MSPSSPATPGGPAGPGSPTGPCTPSRPVGPIGPFSPCKEQGKDATSPSSTSTKHLGTHHPSVHSSQPPAPCSPGRLSLLLLQGDPVGLDALGDQWGPLILLHLAPQGSPERERWSQTLREGDPRTPDQGSQKNSKSDASWLIPNPLCPARGSCHILPSILLHTSVPFPGSYPQPPRGPRLTAGPGGPAGPSFPFKPGPPCEPDLGQQVRWEGEASQAGDPKKMCWKV